MTTTESEKKQTAFARAVAGLVAIGLVVWLVAAMAGHKNSSHDDGGGKFMAQQMCHDFLKQRLKSPSSAHFPDDALRSLSANTYTVSGPVDAENSFGAAIRSSYVCKVKYAGGDKWNLISMFDSENP
jgi:hypothetical protein